MTLKEIMGITEDGHLNISSFNLTEVIKKCSWSKVFIKAETYLINFCIVKYNDADVWYIIARANNLVNGICPANSYLMIPDYQSLTNILNESKNSNSTLGEEVLI